MQGICERVVQFDYVLPVQRVEQPINVAIAENRQRHDRISMLGHKRRLRLLS
jgi:hypothetical protein